MGTQGAENSIDVTTLSSVLEQVFTKALGTVMPQMAAQAVSSFAVPMAARMVGIDGNMNAVVSTNMSGEGVWQMQNMQRQQHLQQRVSDHVSQQAMQAGLVAAAMARTPEDDWIASYKTSNPSADDLTTAELHSRYQADMNRQARDWASKKGMGTVYAMLSRELNWDGVGQSGQYIGAMASSLAAQGFRNDPYRGAAAARKIAENFFNEVESVTDGEGNKTILTNADGSYRMTSKMYDAADWGGQSQESVSQLASHIARTTDLMSGVDLDVPEQLSRAGENIKDVVKAYANALQPLKDIFGNDMQSMVQALESYTGQSLTQSGITRISTLSNQLAARHRAGYDITGVGNGLLGKSWTGYMDNEISRNYDNINSGVMRGNAVGTAMFGMDLAQGANLGFGYYTKDQWEKKAKYAAFNIGNSQGTDNVAMGYALWKRQQPADAGTSFGDYMAAVRANMDSGMDMNAAVMKTANVNSFTELRAGTALDGYAEALQSGDAASANLDLGALPRLREMAEYQAQSDKALGTALSVSGYQGSSKHLFNMMADLQSKDPQLFAITDEKLRSARMRDRGLSENDIAGMNVMINYSQVNQDSALGRYTAMNQQAQNIERRRIEDGKAEMRRDIGFKMHAAMVNRPTGELVADILNGKEGTTFTDRIKDKLAASDIGLNGMEVDAARGIIDAAATFVASRKDDIYRDISAELGISKDDVAKLAEMTAEQAKSAGVEKQYEAVNKKIGVRYMNMYNAFKDPRFMESSEYTNALATASDSSRSAADRRQAAELMMIYGLNGGDMTGAIDRFMSNNIYDDNNNNAPMSREDKINKLGEWSKDPKELQAQLAINNARSDLASNVVSPAERNAANDLLKEFSSFREQEKKSGNLTGDIKKDFEAFRQTKMSDKDFAGDAFKTEALDTIGGYLGERTEGTGENADNAEPGQETATQLTALADCLNRINDTMQTLNSTLTNMSGNATGSRALNKTVPGR